MKTLTGYWKFLKYRFLIASLSCAVFLLSSTSLTGQSDSLLIIEQGLQDTVHYKKLDPRKAMFYSAILPGLGQIYNAKYWKLPFVYAGFAVTYTIVYYYQDIYHQYLGELYTLKLTGAAPSGRTETNIRYVVDRARRNRDYWVILSGVWYILQIVDAHVDAHLQEFKVNKELRLSLEPSVQQNVLIGRTSGFSLTFKF